MDDFVCWGDDKAAMIALGREIQSFVEEELGFALKHPPCPQRTARGMDFLGYRMFPDHAELNRRSKVRYWRRRLLLAALHDGCMISACVRIANWCGTYSGADTGEIAAMAKDLCGHSLRGLVISVSGMAWHGLGIDTGCPNQEFMRGVC